MEKPGYDADMIDAVVKLYYRVIYRFCLFRLSGDHTTAMECTQQRFLIMMEKKPNITLDNGFRKWLLRTADHVVQSHKRQERRRCERFALIPLPLIFDDEDFQRALEVKEVLNCLDDDELDLMMEYFSGDSAARRELAEKLGLTMAQLYKKIHTLRQRVIRHAEELDYHP